MQSNLETLEAKVLQLPEDQRIALAHKIIQSTEPPQDLCIGQWWEAELVRRIDLLDSDQTGLHPASEVFQQLDERLAK
jgi:putative addiction module component (TIGR02574 family)